MIARGPCASCGSGLAADQRYCIECGARVGPPMALPYAPATPAETAAAGSGVWAALPVPAQTLTVAAALALGFGVVVGTALSPNLVTSLAGPVVVQQAPPAAAPEPESSGGGGAGGGGAQIADAVPADTFAGPAPVSEPGDGGGGDGTAKEPKEKPPLLTGTVIHNNPVAGSYSLATGGSVSSIHARALPPPGTVVRTPIELLANRTYDEAGKRQVKGQASEASFAAFVTDSRDSDNPDVPDSYAVSLRGSSILIHMPPDDPNDAADQEPPPIGALATVTVEIRTPAAPTPTPRDANPPALGCTPPQPPPFPATPVVPAKELHQKSLSFETPDVSSVEIATVVQGVCPDAGQVLVSADDVREGGLDVMLAPQGIDPARLAQGEPIIGSVQVESNQGVTRLTGLTGVLSDRGVSGANTESASQGDLALAAAR